MTYHDMIDALRGFGEYMTRMNRYDVKRTLRIMKEDRYVGYIVMSDVRSNEAGGIYGC